MLINSPKKESSWVKKINTKDVWKKAIKLALKKKRKQNKELKKLNRKTKKKKKIAINRWKKSFETITKYESL